MMSVKMFNHLNTILLIANSELSAISITYV